MPIYYSSPSRLIVLSSQLYSNRQTKIFVKIQRIARLNSPCLFVIKIYSTLNSKKIIEAIILGE